MPKSKGGKLGLFILMKGVRMATLLVAICFISFLLVKNSPIDPIQAYIGADMLKVGPEQREKIAEYWGLDQPVMVQFLSWGSAVLKGDLGTSMIFRRPVSEIIGERFLNSLVLMLAAWLLSGVIGFVMGVVAAMKKGTWIDRMIKWYCFTLASTPTFWMGLLILIVFAVWLGWFPVGMGVPAGVLSENVTMIDRIQHLILPVLTLSILGVANVALHTRQKLIDVLASDYVLFARARGEQGFVLFWRHGLRNVALPAITLQFAAFSELFGGAVLAEQVFSYPGLGQATVEAGLRGDVPLLLGLVIFSTIFVFVGNLLADLSYHVLDPRMKEVRKL
ncbi:ABC transporter permease [Viridibacillus sp. FSL R5-0477]|uniref:Binding-protein-dependent transport system inner membrane protein n=1 Tax=Viridibacillus arenosi FSL R5-213 TaxID=1227360 RepID=W4ETD3_9BACL|nr:MULTISPECIES: ABC transporter permease [Viridibacillus]ETT83071.1 binding-protein-dependent transport system inner membrane protein [Viridibacillus arenosi FSL R5-213]OMC81991.1 ABC transporter permease [Viridibacillus sp. FSL H8-0123]OMC90946.1 ABC transporter permease [Viridibacillus arenosi]